MVMSVLFFIPLVTIGIFEAELDPSKNKWVKDWLSHPDQGLDDSPEYRDPEVDGEDAAMSEAMYKGVAASTYAGTHLSLP